MKRAFRTCAAAAIAVGATIGLGVQDAQAGSTPGWRFVEVYPQSQWFDSVSASSAANAWAVGVTGPSGLSCENTCLFTSHWNGKAWRTIPEPDGLTSPNINVGNVVVAATTRSSAWVFAARENIGEGEASQVAAFEWNGTSWSAVHDFAGSSYLGAAIAAGPADVWGFGATGRGDQTPWAVHYNGKTWSRVSIPVSPYQASGSAATGDWVLGQLTPQPKSGPVLMLLHWSRGAWKRLPLPKMTVPKGQQEQPELLAVGTPTSVWASVHIGPSAGFQPGTTVLLHWNGKGWSKVPLPKGAGLRGLVSDGHGGFWMASYSVGKSTGVLSIVMYHYSAGHWTHVSVPAKAGFSPGLNGNLELIPGTGSVLGPGILTDDRTDAFEGAILKYGP
jgi:hypothetical protein